MKDKLTIDDVLSHNPCSEYTRERVETLFAGRETITAKDVLAMDIGNLDKIWIIDVAELISEEDTAAIKEKILSEMDADSKNYLMQKDNCRLWQWGPICRHHFEKDGTPHNDTSDRTQENIINALSDVINKQ